MLLTHQTNFYLDHHPELIKYIYTITKRRTGFGTLLSEDHYATHPLFKPIVDYTASYILDCLKYVSKKPLLAWSIIQEPGIEIVSHEHTPFKWSAVYYVQTTEPPAHLYVEGEKVKPINGLIVTFPGHAMHWVDKNESETDRIAIGIAFP